MFSAVRVCTHVGGTLCLYTPNTMFLAQGGPTEAAGPGETELVLLPASRMSRLAIPQPAPGNQGHALRRAEQAGGRGLGPWWLQGCHHNPGPLCHKRMMKIKPALFISLASR